MLGRWTKTYDQELVLGWPHNSEVVNGSPYLVAKRCFDILVTLMIAPFALAIVAPLALAIRIREGQSAFYSQPRLGKGGRIFNLWKLRTMVPNGERKLEEYLVADPLARTEWEQTQKLRSDPRVTALGRYLRKYSLDELPQLLNVLRGDMSLVGPRPMLPEQWPSYPGTAYLEMRPGLTGLWQIGDRNRSTFADRAVHDTRYSTMMSLSTDLWILFRTPAVVFKGTGF